MFRELFGSLSLSLSLSVSEEKVERERVSYGGYFYPNIPASALGDWSFKFLERSCLPI
jgi:hypothetical protein